MSRHPVCAWSEQLIVDELPKSCPMRARNPLTVLGEIQDIAWEEIGESSKDTFATGDLRGGLDALNMKDTCAKCLAGGMMGDSRIHRLRTQILREEPPL